MKIIIKTISLLIIGLYINTMQSQTSNRSVIADKIEFYYYDDPTSIFYMGIDNEQVKNGTETGSFWTNANTAPLRDFVRALLKDSNNGGDPALQYYTAKLLQVNNRKIQVYLWNDVTAFKASDVSWLNLHNPKPNKSGHVWPHAAHWTPQQDADWGGYMDMGIHYLNANDLQWLKKTFLHELTHTQDKTLQLGDSYVVMRTDYRYSQDGKHYYEEAIPNNRLAYMEAIAHVSAFSYDLSDFNTFFTWFVNNGDLLVERNAPSSHTRNMRQLYGYNDNVWLYDEIREATGNNGTRLNNRYSTYKIQDLPGKFIVHNETIMGMMMTMSTLHIAEIDPFMWTIKTFNDRISRRQSQDPFALFVKIFSEGLLVNGESISHIKQELDNRNYSISPSDDVPYAFILPLAYSDYFTGYTSTTKNDFKELFNNEMESDLIDIYWDHFKTKIRTNIPIVAGRTWSDMTDIAIQCGVNQSSMPGTSGRRFEGN